MSEPLTTLMHDTAGRVHPRLQQPAELRRRAERRRRARRGAAAIAIVAAVSLIVMVMTTGLRTAQRTDLVPAQQPDWAPAPGNSAVGEWEIARGPTVDSAASATSGCKPAGTGCEGFYIRLVAINRAEVTQEANSLTATGRYTDRSGVWRAECRRAAPPRASQSVQPGQRTTLYCDHAGNVLESIENVDRTSIKLIEN